MKETKTLNIQVHRTPAGEPTCSTMLVHESCKFLTSRKWGSIETCVWTGEDLLRGAGGFLVPTETCPLWSPDAAPV